MTARIFPQASRLGFGCASLGSRIGAARGIAALEQAFAGGVNWFDLAPSYGDGAAETIFARFACGRRDRIHICTKHGIEPARHGGVAQVLKPLAQRAVGAVPALRGLAARGRSAPRSLPLSSRGIRDGLDSSLIRLATDYVDVFALHDPDPATLDRDDIRCTLEDILRSGKARAVGIAGSVEAAVVALQAGLPIQYVQMADPPLADSPARRLVSAGPDASYFLATHSIYGRTDPLQVLLARAGSPGRLGGLLTAHGYTTPIERAARAAVLDRALATNPHGVVLLSMFTAAHLEDNLVRLHEGSPRQAEALFQEPALISAHEPA
jgi:aldo/keto reductase family protein